MSRKIFTDEIAAFIRKHVKGLRNKKLADMVNEEFNLNLTATQVKNYKGTHKLKSGLGTAAIVPKRLLSKEQHQYFLKNYKGTTSRDLTKMINDKFSSNFTMQQIIDYKDNNGYSSGLPSDSWQPIGYEYTDVDGYVYVKVKDIPKATTAENYRRKHRILWEKYNDAKLDDDDAVIFKDKDRSNFSADNLVKMSRPEMGRMNQIGLVDDNADINDAIIALSKLGIKARDAKVKGWKT